MTKRRYIHEIADRTCLPHRYRQKIIQDLSQELEDLLGQGYTLQDAMERMGDPDAVAAGLYENYLVAEDATRPFVEYKSSATLFGMPLVHIVKAKRRGLVRFGYHTPQTLTGVPAARGFLAIGRRARGVIAIGNLSCGVVALGNLSAGVFCLSNLGVGLLAAGNLVLGLLGVVGNAALGLFATGNLAVGYSAVGNLGVGRYAIGHMAYGPQALSLENLFLGPEVLQFLEGVPALARPFFTAGVRFAQFLGQSQFFFPILLGMLALAIVLTGILLSNWLEKQARR